ncbi:UbiA family prenyltransferase [Halopiger xanaduensis]|uniref:UbiA prenyltransferase n=1 Tax=Halopiger xanaduensis (strain DSM 18323 / JCM 14033 / SH-6) TaxID=797210 RepID=F8D7A4_HALXS|nr:UbiA family prenyltransferase [Halopiger xanaduensis]AEH37821.1 UbiA prenyltransferase [Halopiger xanaduensis SH-6]
MISTEGTDASRENLQTVRTKLRTFLTVLRVRPAVNCVTLAFVGVVLHPGSFDWATATLAAVVMVLAYGIVYLYNYFTDVEEDRLNDSYNPVLDETYRRVIIGYICAAVVATVGISAVSLGPIPLAVVLFYLCTGVAYSTPPLRFKKRFVLKNVVVALFSGPLLLVMTSSLTGRIAVLDVVMVAFFGITALTTSIVGDFRDVDGDRKAGVRTVPIVLGVRGTGHYVLAWTLVQLLVLVVPVWLGYVDPRYLPVLVAMLPRLRFVYAMYARDRERVHRGPVVPEMVLAAAGLVAAALIDLGIV